MTVREEQLDQLTAYLDDELSPPERAEVEQLLADDPDARKLLDELRRTAGLVAALPRGRAPEGLVDAVTERIERQSLFGGPAEADRRTPRGWSFGRKFAAAASFVLLCTAAWLSWPELTHRPAARRETQLAKGGGVQERALDLSVGYVSGADLKDAVALGPKPESTIENADAPPTRGWATRSRIPIEKAESETVEPPTADAVTLADAIEGESPAELLAAAPKAIPAAIAEVEGPDRIAIPPGTMTASIEQQLIEAKLTNALLREAPPDVFANRIELETDERTMQKLANLIATNMLTNAIPDIGHTSLKEPIGIRQQFFQTRDASAALADRDESQPIGESSAPASQVFTMNIRQDLAEQLLVSMQQTVQDSSAEASWSSNDVRLTGAQPGRQIVLAWSAPDEAGSAESRAPVTVGGRREMAAATDSTAAFAEASKPQAAPAEADDAQTASEPARAGGARPQPVSSETPPADDESADRPASKKNRIAALRQQFQGARRSSPQRSRTTAKQPPLPPMPQGGQTQTADAEENGRFVTLAITLRSTIGPRAQRRNADSVPPLPPQPTSQATTRKSSGG